MKRSICSVLALVLVLIFVGGCQNSGSSVAPASSNPAAVSSETASSQAPLDFPKKTVTIIVPYGAGGGTDLIARAIASHLAEKWGVSVIVDNKTGGSGAVGMSALANSKADGHTVILTALAAATMTPILNDVGYTDKEFAPISQVTEMITMMATNANSKIDTFEALMEKAKANPGQLTYGTTGAASLQNLLTEKLQQEMGTPNLLTHVPFDGGSQAIAALVGEQTDACVAMVPDMLGNIEANVFNPLCVYTAERIPELPDVPCIAELGYPSVALPTWYGFAAPAGTPEEILNFWDEAIDQTLSDPEMIEIFKNIKQTPYYLDRSTFTELWQNTYKMNKEMLGK